jgi:hypothetical protein
MIALFDDSCPGCEHPVFSQPSGVLVHSQGNDRINGCGDAYHERCYVLAGRPIERIMNCWRCNLPKEPGSKMNRAFKLGMLFGPYTCEKILNVAIPMVFAASLGGMKPISHISCAVAVGSVTCLVLTNFNSTSLGLAALGAQKFACNFFTSLMIQSVASSFEGSNFSSSIVQSFAGGLTMKGAELVDGFQGVCGSLAFSAYSFTTPDRGSFSFSLGNFMALPFLGTRRNLAHGLIGLDIGYRFFSEVGYKFAKETFGSNLAFVAAILAPVGFYAGYKFSRLPSALSFYCRDLKLFSLISGAYYAADQVIRRRFGAYTMENT